MTQASDKLLQSLLDMLELPERPEFVTPEWPKRHGRFTSLNCGLFIPESCHFPYIVTISRSYKQEALEWCRNNCNHEFTYDSKWRGSEGPFSEDLVEFGFFNQDEASFFKLVWG